jgi:LysM repeat protein
MGNKKSDGKSPLDSVINVLGSDTYGDNSDDYKQTTAGALAAEKYGLTIKNDISVDEVAWHYLTAQSFTYVDPYAISLEFSLSIASPAAISYIDAHTVQIQKGDTLGKIAYEQSHNTSSPNPITVDDLKKINGLGPGDELKLQIGQKIIVPQKVGDSLIVDYEDYYLNMNAKDGTYQCTVKDTQNNTTTQIDCMLDKSSGKYVVSYGKTDDVTGHALASGSADINQYNIAGNTDTNSSGGASPDQNTSDTTPAFASVPYILPDGTQGIAHAAPGRPALITTETGEQYSVGIDGSVTRLDPTPPGDGTLQPVVFHPDSESDQASSTSTDENDTHPTNTPPAQTLNTAASALLSINALIAAIEHGDTLEGALKIAYSGAQLANALDKLTSGSGNAVSSGTLDVLGSAVSGLNLIHALESGDGGAILSSGFNFANTLSNGELAGEVAGALNQALGTSISVGQLPYGIGAIVSIANGDPMGAVTNALCYAFPEFAPVIMVVSTILGGIFGDEDIPTARGTAQAVWDADGQIQIATSRNEAGGGRAAHDTLANLVGVLQAELGLQTDAAGNPQYALLPQRLPGIKYAYDPDTGEGYLRLTWVDDAGQTQWRHYDTDGQRPDSSIVKDFVAHAIGAIVPVWEAQTVQARIAAGEDVTLPPPAAAGDLALDGSTITRHLLTLGPAAVTQTALDFDGDGYVEQTQWTTSPLLAIDLDGDGRIGQGELVSPGSGVNGLAWHDRNEDGWIGRGELVSTGSGTNGLAWFDGNGDGRIDANDPAFAALKIWTDTNGDGIGQADELQGAAQADIVAFRFDAAGARCEMSDGSTQDLTRQDLTGDTQGIAIDITDGGVLETHEDGTALLYAVNTHEFDGQAEHIHGETAAAWNPDYGLGDARIVSTGHATVASETVRAELPEGYAIGGADSSVAENGQGPGQTLGDETDAGEVTVVSDAPAGQGAETQKVGAGGTAADRIVVGDARVTGDPKRPEPPKTNQPIAPFAFVPAAQGNAGQANAIRQITRDLIQSAESGLFGANATPLAVLAVAGMPLEFPEVVAARREAQQAAAAEAGTGGTLTDADLVAVLNAMQAPAVPTAPAAPTPALVGVGADAYVAAQVVSTPATTPVTTATTTATASAHWTSATVGAAGQGSGTPATPAAAQTTIVLHSDALVSAPATPVFVTPASTTPNPANPDTTAPTSSPATGGPVSLTVTPSPVVPAGVGIQGSTPPPILVLVNHAPTAGGTALATDEDRGLLISPAVLLATASDPDAQYLPQTLSIAAVGNASHGSVSLDADGNIVFFPDADYFGPASFDYTVSDGKGGEIGATARIHIAPVNDAPVVPDQAAAGTEDTRLVFTTASLLANATDIDNSHADLALQAVGNASHGSVAMDAGGHVVFTPDADYFGAASFDITVSDGAGGRTTATVRLDIAPVNDLPVATGETAVIDEDTVVRIAAADLLANDADVDGPALTLAGVSNASHGRVALDNGIVTFTPDANYFGPAGFDYTLDDGAGGTATASVRFDIRSVNDAPTVQGESAAIEEDTPLLIAPASLLANDSDVEDSQSTLVISALGNAQHGTVAWTADADGQPSIAFTPDANFHGQASFDYTVRDSGGATAVGTATIDVAAVNDTPIAAGETTATREDVGLVFTQQQLLANEIDPDIATDGDVLGIVAVGNASGGRVVFDPNGDIRFTPDANYHGQAGFDYTVSDRAGTQSSASVSIDIAAVNDAPVAADDVAGAPPEDTAIEIDSATLLANDSDVDTATDGQVLTITSVGDPLHGSVELLSGGTIRFTPDPDFNGLAGFRYTVEDGAGGSTTAIAVLNIGAVNDAPAANDDAATGHEDNELVFPAASLLANDTDVDIATNADRLAILRVATTDPAAGQASLDADGNVHFIPNRDYFGPAGFTYTLADAAGVEATAMVSLTLLPVNDAPVVTGEVVSSNEDTTLRFNPADLLANETDVDNAHADLAITGIANARHGTVAWADDGSGQIVFTPDADYFGPAGFDYTVSDGAGGEATTTVTLDIADVNDAPVAADDHADGQEDIPFVFTAAQLAANDTDVENDPLTIVAVGNASHGTATLVGGKAVFTPDADYSGPASFDYTMADGRGGQCSASVNLDIAAVNDAPAVNGEIIAGVEETPLLIDPNALLANDTDVDNAHEDLHLTSVGNAKHGTVEQTQTGDILFTPDYDFDGAASFDYTVADGVGGVTTGTTTIQVANINDAPVALGETIYIDEDTVLNLKSTLLANDTDVDNTAAQLRIGSVANASHCSVSVNADGSVRFVPDANYYGPASFDYTVSDGAGGTSNTVTANFNIASVNDAPIVSNESATIAEDNSFSTTAASLLQNDTDVETPGSLAVSSVWGASHGTVGMSGNSIVFAPDANYNGPASFNYTVTDGEGGVSYGSVSLNVTPVNDVPIVNGEALSGARSGIAMNIAAAALLSNDTDVETPGSLSISQVSNAQHGTVSLSGSTVVFTPQAGYYGTSSFQYTVRDPQGASAVGTATVACAPNQNPVATDDSFTGFEDTPFNIAKSQLLANDRDPDDPGNISVTAADSATHGSVSMSGSNVVFTPDANYNGAASFRYTVSDPYGGSTRATAYLNVQAVNDAPVVTGVNYVGVDARQINCLSMGDVNTVYSSMAVDDPTRSSGTISAYDPEGGALTYSIAQGPKHGYVYLNQQVSPQVVNGLTSSGAHYNGTAGWNEFVSYQLSGENSLAEEVFTTLVWKDVPGGWQYFSREGDSFNGPDLFKIRVSDAGGASTTVDVNVNHYGTNINTGGGCPVVLDMNRNGDIDLVKPEDSEMFADINGDGWKDQIGWAAPGDGVLCYDANGDGNIDVLDEVSFTQYKEGARTDLEGLAGLDSSGDGMISAADDAWTRMGVVAGGASNENGADVAWVSLDQASIASIGLDRQGEPQMNQGNVVFGTSTLTFGDGTQSIAGDVMLAGANVPLPEEAAALFEAPQTSDNAPSDAQANGAVTEVADTSPETFDIPLPVSESTADAVAPVEPDVVTEPVAETTTTLSPTPDEVAASDGTGDAPLAAEPSDADFAGEIATVADAVPAPVVDADAAEAIATAELARIRQQALLFNQVCATADEMDTGPLAFVPSEPEMAAVVAATPGVEATGTSETAAVACV